MPDEQNTLDVTLAGLAVPGTDHPVAMELTRNAAAAADGPWFLQPM
jgi:hypothetical protein